MPTPGRFGCVHCHHADPDAMARHARKLTSDAMLIDESHLIVRLLSCPACGQRFLSCFAETVDWADGEDPQYRTIAPLTEAEAQTLAESPIEAAIDALPPRPHLAIHHPKSGPSTTKWNPVGSLIGPHD